MHMLRSCQSQGARVAMIRIWADVVPTIRSHLVVSNARKAAMPKAAKLQWVQCPCGAGPQDSDTYCTVYTRQWWKCANGRSSWRTYMHTGQRAGPRPIRRRVRALQNQLGSTERGTAGAGKLRLHRYRHELAYPQCGCRCGGRQLATT